MNPQPPIDQNTLHIYRGNFAALYCTGTRRALRGAADGWITSHIEAYLVPYSICR